MTLVRDLPAGRREVRMPDLGLAATRELDVPFLERGLELQQQQCLLDVEELRHGFEGIGSDGPSPSRRTQGPGTAEDAWARELPTRARCAHTIGATRFGARLHRSPTFEGEVGQMSPHVLVHCIRAAALGAALVALCAPAVASAGLPKLGFYCGGPKDASGVCQLGINVYKFRGKTLVTAATVIPSKDFVCQPSGTKGTRAISNKVRLGEMPLKSTGSFKGREKPFIGPPTLTISGKFTSATKVDVTFNKDHLPVGPPGENCVAKKRIVVSLKKQKTNKGLPF